MINYPPINLTEYVYNKFISLIETSPSFLTIQDRKDVIIYAPVMKFLNVKK